MRLLSLRSPDGTVGCRSESASVVRPWGAWPHGYRAVSYARRLAARPGSRADAGRAVRVLTRKGISANASESSPYLAQRRQADVWHSAPKLMADGNRDR